MLGFPLLFALLCFGQANSPFQKNEQLPPHHQQHHNQQKQTELCSSINSCADCFLQQATCSWCRNTSSCVSRTVSSSPNCDTSFSEPDSCTLSSCFSFTSCSTCLRFADTCSWCASSSSSNSPASGSFCTNNMSLCSESNKSFHLITHSSTRCDAVFCSTFSSCHDCAHQSDCGWCSNAGMIGGGFCYVGSFTGPQFGECSTSSWLWIPSQCNPSSSGNGSSNTQPDNNNSSRFEVVSILFILAIGACVVVVLSVVWLCYLSKLRQGIISQDSFDNIPVSHATPIQFAIAATSTQHNNNSNSSSNNNNNNNNNNITIATTNNDDHFDTLLLSQNNVLTRAVIAHPLTVSTHAL